MLSRCSTYFKKSVYKFPNFKFPNENTEIQRWRNLEPNRSQVEQREGEGFVKVFLSENISFVKEKTIYEGKFF